MSHSCSSGTQAVSGGEYLRHILNGKPALADVDESACYYPNHIIQKTIPFYKHYHGISTIFYIKGINCTNGCGHVCTVGTKRRKIVSSDEISGSLPRPFDVERTAVMVGEVGGERVFRFAAMHLVDVLLALAVKTCVEFHWHVLTAEYGDIVRELAVHAAAEAKRADTALGFYIEAEIVRVNAGISARAADYSHRLVEHL